MQHLETQQAVTAPAGAVQQPAADGISLREFLAILSRRRLVLLQSFVIIAVVAVFWTFMTKAVYQSSARLLVEARSTTISTADTTNPFAEILAMTEPETVDTQVEVLRSPSLAEKVRQAVGPVNLTVKAVDDTNVIEVTAEANSAQRAANAANVLLKDYIDQDVDQSQQEIQNAIVFARNQESEAQKLLDQTESGLESFKLEHHLSDLDTDRGKQADQVSQLTATQKQTQLQLAGLDSQLAETRRQLAAEPATITSEVKTSNTDIDSIRQKIADLEQQRSGLIQPGGFTAQAPQVRAIDGQIDQLQQRLSAQPALADTKTINPNTRPRELRAKIADMEAQEASLKSQLAVGAKQVAEAQSVLGQYAGWEVKLGRLQRDHDDALSMDRMLTDKLAELSLREQAHHATARIDEYAQAPTDPIRPKRTLNIILGAFFGLFVGICMALLQEFLDDRINTVEDAHRILGLPTLGYVPALGAEDAKLLPMMRRVDPAAESYRLLRTNIHFAAIDNPLRTLLVTSSQPGEGKTTSAANLAFAMALDGKRVLLADTDLRRPSVHKLLEIPMVPGLTDVLLGRATLEDTILPNSAIPNLCTLTAGSMPPNPAELLNSHAFDAVRARMAEEFDIVIFDSPPLLVAADSAILAAKMDGTVLVVATGDTKKGPASQAVALLRKARAKVLGIAYNKMRSQAGEGYYYSYTYNTNPLEGEDDLARQLAVEAHEE